MSPLTAEGGCIGTAKAREPLAAYAEGLPGTEAGAIAAANANWDKAAEHAARCAPYLHHKLVAVGSQNRKLSEMTTEELEGRSAGGARGDRIGDRGRTGARAGRDVEGGALTPETLAEPGCDCRLLYFQMSQTCGSTFLPVRFVADASRSGSPC